MDDAPEMLDFLKAVSEVDRLKIVGILTQGPASLKRLADDLSQPVRATFNHLEFLAFVGVVERAGENYQLTTDGLQKMARLQFEPQASPISRMPGLEPGRQKELAKYLGRDGSIRQIPNSRTQAEAFRLVLEYLQTAFEPGTTYTEKEVNLIISRFNPDFAGLRRDLVDAGLLQRERDGSRYWRPAVERQAGEQ
jgi:hypothetical protein